MPSSIHLSTTKKRKLDLLISQANQTFAASNFTACERLCRKIDRLVYGLPNVLNLRGSMAASQGKLERARSLFEQAIRAAPEQADFVSNLARVCALSGQVRKAAELYQCLFSLAARHGDQQRQKDACDALIDLGAGKQAVQLLKILCEQYPDDTELRISLASAYSSLSEYDETHQLLEPLLPYADAYSAIHVLMGDLEAQEGRMQEAERHFRQAQMLEPDDASALIRVVSIRKYRDPEDTDLRALQRLYREAANNPEARENICFALGKVLDDLGDCDQAFRYLAEGNTLRRQRSPYLENLELEHIDHLIRAYQPPLESSGLSNDAPIFIISMPRSGSTLTEQILASHPDVDSRGECNAFECVAIAAQHSDKKPLTLDRISRFTSAQWAQVGQDYLNHVYDEEAASQYRRITDKSLTNTRMIGAIHCALPKAKIIHVRRHPLDTCLSIFKQNLEGDVFCYGTDLTALGRYYQAYMRLMDHWRTLLPEGVMLEVNYEDIVQDQQGQTHRMLEFCGLDWNDACLQFHKRRSQVNTASVAQVRRPMYKDSIAAWQRYEKHLQPLIDVLGTDNPWISEGRGRQV